jgi:glycosyltransferase involved in cell wall biosynthesis
VVAPYQVATGSSATVHRAVTLGRPVVVTDLPEFRAMAREEDLWLEFVPRDNPAQLAAVLRKLWTESDRRDAIARHNFVSAQRHSLTSTTDAYLRLLEGQAHCPAPIAISRSASSAG